MLWKWCFFQIISFSFTEIPDQSFIVKVFLMLLYKLYYYVDKCSTYELITTIFREFRQIFALMQTNDGISLHQGIDLTFSRSFNICRKNIFFQIFVCKSLKVIEFKAYHFPSIFWIYVPYTPTAVTQNYDEIYQKYCKIYWI